MKRPLTRVRIKEIGRIFRKILEKSPKLWVIADFPGGKCVYYVMSIGKI